MPKNDEQDIAAATMAGFEALVQELKEDRQHRTKHEKEIVNRIGRYKENPDGSPKRSVFNQQGQRDYPLPVLKCEIHAPWKIDADPEISGLTREEIELVNLLEPGKYRITLNDNAERELTIEAEHNKATQQLEKMRVSSEAFGRELFKQMPPMTRWLREVLAQHPDPIPARADAVLSMKQEAKGIKAGEIAVGV